MQYLIGEIGLSLLVASLIGLCIGWLIGRFRASRFWLTNRRRLESDVYHRDREIERLRDDLRYSAASGRGRGGQGARGQHERSQHRGPSASVASGERSMSIAAGRGQSDTDRYAVARRDMRDSASVTVRGNRPSSATRASDLRDATYTQSRTTASASTQQTDPKTSGSRSDAAMRERLDEETHQKVQALATAGERETELKRKLDAESYEKIQALALSLIHI